METFSSINKAYKNSDSDKLFVTTFRGILVRIFDISGVCGFAHLYRQFVVYAVATTIAQKLTSGGGGGDGGDGSSSSCSRVRSNRSVAVVIADSDERGAIAGRCVVNDVISRRIKCINPCRLQRLHSQTLCAVDAGHIFSLHSPTQNSIISFQQQLSAGLSSICSSSVADGHVTARYAYPWTWGNSFKRYNERRRNVKPDTQRNHEHVENFQKNAWLYDLVCKPITIISKSLWTN